MSNVIASPVNFLALLEAAMADEQLVSGCPPNTRAAFLAEFIFDFTTYEDEFAHEFGVQALRVCRAISARKTYEFAEPTVDRRWFLLMCNMPFFSRRINWGTSIRGAWWDITPPNEQWLELPLNHSMLMDSESWPKFITALLMFAGDDLAAYKG